MPDTVVSPSCFRSSLPFCPFSWCPLCHSFRPSVVFESCNVSRPSMMYSLLDKVTLNKSPAPTDPVVSTWIGSQLWVNGRTVGVRKARCHTAYSWHLTAAAPPLPVISITRATGSRDGRRSVGSPNGARTPHLKNFTHWKDPKK